MWYSDTVLETPTYGCNPTAEGDVRLAEQGITWSQVGDDTWFSQGDIDAISQYYAVNAPPSPPTEPPGPPPDSSDEASSSSKSLSDIELGLIVGGGALGVLVLGVIIYRWNSASKEPKDSEVTMSLM